MTDQTADPNPQAQADARARAQGQRPQPAGNQYDQIATRLAIRQARAQAATSPNILDRPAPTPGQPVNVEHLIGGSRRIDPADLGYTPPPPGAPPVDRPL